MSAKPLIGIMLDCAEEGSFSSFPHHALQKSYFRAVEAAGGLPVGVPCDSALHGEYLARVNGMVMPGGDYQMPAEWYADGKQSDFAPNPARAKGELALLRAVLEKNIPFLGICNGMQVMAVALGGKLTSLLPTTPINHRPGTRYAPQHTLKIVPGTRLHAIAGDSMRANTHHKEGVVALSSGCIASAHAEDGVIEAIEYPPHLFALGVQWHPEHMLDDEKNLKIFQSFVAACS